MCLIILCLNELHIYMCLDASIFLYSLLPSLDMIQRNNQIARKLGVEYGVITTKTPFHRLEFDSCIFKDNNYGDESLAVRNTFQIFNSTKHFLFGF